LKALYLKGYINGHSINKMLVDTSASVGAFCQGLDQDQRYIERLQWLGIRSIRRSQHGLTVGSKTVPTSFFIINSKSTYTVLLRRDWIHANCCIPSMMHQCLIQWDGKEVEVVHADDSIEISLAAMSVWDAEDQEPISGISLEGCDRVEATKNRVRLVLSTGLIE
jgi:hypothetical protein